MHGKWIGLLLACGVLGACGPTSPFHHGRLGVAAAEDTWGSLAAQVGGDRVSVHSIITDPAADPHSYEPKASDAVAFASARLVIVNGIGYDPWASQLEAAGRSRGSLSLDVGDLLGLHVGDNPHQWYSPGAVRRVVDRIAADYARLDPRDATYFAARRTALLTRGLERYDRLVREIRTCCAGTPVGYSESIFEPLGRALGLRLATPSRFARAVAEGTDVSAADKRAVDRIIAGRGIAAWIYNRQNVTPDVQQVNALARADRIPIVSITETLDPATATFQGWQSDQLQRLLRALRKRRP